MSTVTAENYVIRTVRPHEWPALRRLRLDALRDPVAPIAFVEDYEQAAARPDSFWQERAARSGAEDGGVRQVIAEAPDGTWAGTVTVLIEEPGTTDFAGLPVERRQGHLVGVFVRPEHRGSGLVEALFEAGTEWAWRRGVERVRLVVHEDNVRARGAYRKAGFVPSGVVVSFSEDAEDRELELVLARPSGLDR
ncbi:GNAT family N-acetyltransferase [Streptomyces sp. TG1A-8]|uniref:GNAT family N-acetyltransferase n=1 Tax=Streptomyces sp. TG1A-8 TaxID=3051385 RepID=UPI00265C83DF|nr:GNAT family N-acetyltransferase [Streptomyces sp. TG1A-8]MDO0927042.1 GNAT family N-acetyltransferase [Streptomyces sp. TG1A-8]